MGGDDDAELLRQLQRVIQLGVVEAEGAFVGEEDFERAMPRFTISRSCFRRLVVEPRHAHVKREIARRIAVGLCHPEFEALERVVLRAGSTSR